MRTTIALLLTLAVFTLSAQVEESFTDGDFTHNPVWIGEGTNFVVNAQKQLQLNATGTGKSYLSTPSSRVKDTEWKFRVKINYNTSSQNYMTIFLCTDNSNLKSTTLSGYMLRIGHTDDNLVLFKLNKGTQTALVTGEKGRTGYSTNDLEIVVSCDAAGNWKLSSKRITEEAFVKEGSTVLDKNLAEGKYFGLMVVYSSTQSKNYYLDDITIRPLNGTGEEEEEEEDKPDPDDVTSPQMLSCMALKENLLELTFDEKVVITRLTMSLLSPLQTPDSVILSNDKLRIRFYFSPSFTPHEERAFTLTGVMDLNGNLMQGTTHLFTYSPPEFPSDTAQFGQVVFSEIMANPTGVAGLPEVEYVELYNRSNNTFNLKGWEFVYDNRRYSLKTYELKPKQYVILCHESKVIQFDKNIPIIGVASFPTLNNTGKLIQLLDNQGDLMAWADYTDGWYQDTNKKGGGWSLECIDPGNLIGKASNWGSSSSTKGGTPGSVNAISRANPDNETPAVRSSGIKGEDTVVVNFSKPMALATLCDPNNYNPVAPHSLKMIGYDTPKGEFVELILNEPIEKGDEVTIEISGLRCISGRAMTEGNATIKLFRPEEAATGDVVINELLFHPTTDGAEYIELYNRSDKMIDLSSLGFCNRNSGGELTKALPLATMPSQLRPGEYRCFTIDPTLLARKHPLPYPERVVSMTKLPSLPNSSGTIVVTNQAGMVIDELQYTEKMQTVAASARQGVALERKSVYETTQNPHNWQSASTLSGYGTPGYENSSGYVNPTGTDSVWLESDIVYLNMTNSEGCLTLHYTFGRAEYKGSVRIYDLQGRLISTPANNIVLGSKGTVKWEQNSSNITRHSVGPYLLLFEYRHPDGTSKQKRIPFVISTGY